MGQGLSRRSSWRLFPASSRRHELRPGGRAGTHERQLAPLHQPELGEVLLQLLCGKTHLVTWARRLRAALARPPPGLCRYTRRGRPTPPATAAGRDGRGGRRLTARHRPGNLSHEDVEEPPGAAPDRPHHTGRRHVGTSVRGRGGGRDREREGEGWPHPGRPEMAAAALTREGGEDAFRRLFRFYRQRDASDLRGVVDFSAPGGQVMLGCFCSYPAASGSERVPCPARCLGAGLWRCRCSPFSPPAVSFRARRRIPTAASFLARRRCTPALSHLRVHVVF